jgi:hypothetical protein
MGCTLWLLLLRRRMGEEGPLTDRVRVGANSAASSVHADHVQPENAAPMRNAHAAPMHAAPCHGARAARHATRAYTQPP